MEGNDDDEEGLFAPMMILLKRVFVIGNTSTHTHEKVFSFFLFPDALSSALTFKMPFASTSNRLDTIVLVRVQNYE